MSDRPRSRRRLGLVAVTVTALAGAGIAGSLVLPAEAAPTPSPVRATTVPASVAGVPARTADGRQYLVPLATAGASRGVAGGDAPSASVRGAVAPAAAAAPAAVAAPRPPAVTDVPGTDLVVSSRSNLAFAPDGSRIAFVDNAVVYTAHPDGKGLVATGRGQGIRNVSWSPNGRFLAVVNNRQAAVFTAERGTGITIPAVKTDERVSTSWLGSSDLVLTYRIKNSGLKTVAVIPLFGGKARFYPLPAGSSVLDATGSPDSTRIALRRQDKAADGTVTESIVVVDAATFSLPTVAATTTGTFGRPAWSRDSTLVYAPRTQGGVTALVSHLDVAAEGEVQVVVPDLGANPYVYLRPTPAGPAIAQRFSGRDAIATSVALSRDMFARAQGRSCNQIGAAVSVVLARVNSVEATIAGPLAQHVCGPMLVTGTKSLDSRAAAEMRRLLTKGRTVYLVGNTASLSAAVATQVAKLGYKVVRYGGRDTYDTAVQVALRGWKKHATAAISSASQPLAAVVASSTAGAVDVPLLLTNGTKMPAGTLAFIDKYRVGAWAVGSQAVAAAPWAYRYTGKDDVATSLAVATNFFYPPVSANLITASAVPDAYVASAIASYGVPVFVVAPKAVPTTVRTYLDKVSGSLDIVRLFGATKNVRGSVLSDAASLAAGRKRV